MRYLYEVYPSVIYCWVLQLDYNNKKWFQRKRGVGHFWGKWEVLLCFLKSAFLQGDAASLSHLSSTLTTHSTHHLHFITAQWIYYIHRIPPSLLNKLVAMKLVAQPSGREQNWLPWTGYTTLPADSDVASKEATYTHTPLLRLQKISSLKQDPRHKARPIHLRQTEKSKQLKKKSKMKKQTRKTREHQKQKKNQKKQRTC